MHSGSRPQNLWQQLRSSIAASAATLAAHVASATAHGISAFGATLVDDANASTARTTLGLGTLATQSGTFSGTSSGTNTGDQTISLTGDVTGSGTGSFAASISSSVLTTAARTVTDDTTVAAMVDTLGGASSTGTGGLVRTTSPTLVTPLLGTPTSGTLTNCTGLPAGGISDATATPTASKIPIASSLGHLDKGWIRPHFYDRRMSWVQHNTSGTQTVSRFGLVADPTLVGTTITDGEAVGGSYEGCQSGLVSGNTAGRITTTGWYRDWSPRFVTRVLTHTNINLCRYWFGFTSADLSGVTTPTTQSVAAFRYDTGTDGTAFWRCITCDGASNVTATTTTIAIASSTAYNLRIEIDDANAAVRFYVDDVLAATHTTNRPASATALLVQLAVTTLTSNLKKFSWSWFGIDSI